MRTGKKQKFSAFNYSTCAKCQKCSESCPARIDIPKMLELYRQCKCGNVQELYHVEERNAYGTPLDCIECGACSAHCPKRFPVREMIRALAMLQCGVCGLCQKAE